MTGAWGGGYVTDTTYMPGYYVQQSPDRMVLALQVAGYETPFALGTPEREGLHYLELGCGEGLTATVLAASNPGWRVTAVDFNPAHVAAARRLATAAGVDNVTFLEADLSTLAESPAAAALPDVDVVSLHGVWSWVPRAVQDGIVRLLLTKLRPGGIAHVSYNALPGWQSGLAMARMVRESGLRLGTRSADQAAQGAALTKALLDAEALQLLPFKLANNLLDKLGEMPSEYLAHEYMNTAWAPCWHADVAGRMSEAKLDWVATSQPLDCFADLMLTEAQRAVHDRFDDPLLRELIKDVCCERLLRHDLFVRGARRASVGERDAALAQTTLMLTVAADDFRYEVGVPAGKAGMNEAVYRPIVAALARAPRSVAELVRLPDLAGRPQNLPEIVAMLVGSGQAMPLARPDAEPGARAQRLNAAAARRYVRLDRLVRGAAAASERVGGGFVLPLVELYLVERMQAAGGMIAPALCAAELAPGESDEVVTRLTERIGESLAVQPRLWRQAGVL